jgi:mono/diheme cytochrome c family protein
MESPAGAVAVDESPYPFTQAQAREAGLALKNPLPHSPDVIAHGRFVWDNVCVTCHGPRGAGDGTLTIVFPKPPSLMTQRVRDWPDGEIFHRPMRGQGSMPSHARQLDARDIWSVVHYIRQMQSEEAVAPASAPAAAASSTATGATAGQAPTSVASIGGRS